MTTGLAWASLWACLAFPPAVDPALSAPVLLGGQASLSVDHWRETATLRVRTYQVKASPLPEDRQGIPLGDCARIVPETSGSGMVYEAEKVHALCPGYTLQIIDHHSGSTTWGFDRMPEAGLVCSVAIGEASEKLPPLPELPALQIDGREATWEPSGADEVRLVNLGASESSGVCRLPDVGQAKLPSWMKRGDTTLVTKHNARLTELNKRPMSLSATSGTWLNKAAP